MKTVLLILLWLIVANLLHRIDERKAQAFSQAPRKVGNQLRVPAGRYATYPLRCRIGYPTFPDHLRHRLDQIITETTGAFGLSDDATPSGVPPAG